MFCPDCGTEISPESRFCRACGTTLQSAAPAFTAPPSPSLWTPPAYVEVRASHWIREGWRLVQSDLTSYILLGFVFLALGSVAPGILQGALIAGLHIFTMKKLIGRPAEFSDFFKGFAFFLPTLFASIVIGIFVGLASLFFLIPGLVVAAMYKFTYLFIVDKGMDFWPAMRASHQIVRRNYVGFTLFLLLMVLVNCLGLLCFVVGISVTIPITFAAITVAYREIVGFEPGTVASMQTETAWRR